MAMAEKAEQAGEIVADLHLHSAYSDGLHTPFELMELATGKGLKAFSITDHDSVSALKEVQTDKKITFIPGVEITATSHGREVHILGYYIKHDTPELVETLAGLAKKRKKRLFNIVANLNIKFKTGIDTHELADWFSKKAFNRLNLARFMVEKGLSYSIKECFKKYIGDSNEVYEAVDYFPPKDAINLIHKCGGLAFLAHPYLLKEPGIIPELVEQGLDGIEAFHPSHSPGNVSKSLEWAERFQLGVSGGSDFHGNVNSKRKLLVSGLTGERLNDFLALNPDRDFVAA